LDFGIGLGICYSLTSKRRLWRFNAAFSICTSLVSVIFTRHVLSETRESQVLISNLVVIRFVNLFFPVIYLLVIPLSYCIIDFCNVSIYLCPLITT